MPSHYYGVQVPGAKVGDVVADTSSTGLNVELVIVDGVSGNRKLEITQALIALKAYFEGPIDEIT